MRAHAVSRKPREGPRGNPKTIPCHSSMPCHEVPLCRAMKFLVRALPAAARAHHGQQGRIPFQNQNPEGIPRGHFYTFIGEVEGQFVSNSFSSQLRRARQCASSSSFSMPIATIAVRPATSTRTRVPSAASHLPLLHPLRAASNEAEAAGDLVEAPLDDLTGAACRIQDHAMESRQWPKAWGHHGVACHVMQRARRAHGVTTTGGRRGVMATTCRGHGPAAEASGPAASRARFFAPCGLLVVYKP